MAGTASYEKTKEILTSDRLPRKEDASWNGNVLARKQFGPEVLVRWSHVTRDSYHSWRKAIPKKEDPDDTPPL